MAPSLGPSAYHNLEAHPQTVIEVGRDTIAVTAAEVSGEERERLFGAHAQRSPQFTEYQQKTAHSKPRATPDG